MWVLHLLKYFCPPTSPAEEDDLIQTWLFLAACLAGVAMEEETSPYLVQGLSYAMGIQVFLVFH